MSESNQEGAPVFRCLTTGIGLNQARKTLKVAFPRKKQEGVTLLRFTGTPDALQVTLPGAADRMPAMVSGPFICDMPWLSFQSIWENPRDDRALLTLRFSSGWFEVEGMVTRSPEIKVYPTSAEPGTSGAPAEAAVDGSVAPPAMENSPRPIDPADVPQDLPLLEPYFYLQQNGLRPLMGNQPFYQQTEQVDRLLNRAGKLLAPLGISRGEIERLLNQKFGSLQPDSPKPQP